MHDLWELIHQEVIDGKYQFILYETPQGSIRCYDLEDSNKTLRDEENNILHDYSLLQWLCELTPSNL